MKHNLTTAPVIARILNRNGFTNKRHTMFDGYFIQQIPDGVLLSYDPNKYRGDDYNRIVDEKMNKMRFILNRHGYDSTAFSNLHTKVQYMKVTKAR